MPLMASLKDRTPPDYQIDALASEWTEDSYLNPPYSNPLPFVQKALKEHKERHIKVVLLLKLDTSTKWYRELVGGGAHFLFFAERLHYSDGGSAPFPSVLAILSE